LYEPFFVFYENLIYSQNKMNQPLLIETVSIENKQIRNAELHNARIKKTLTDLFNQSNSFMVENVIELKNVAEMYQYKCRIIYSDTIQYIDYQTYHPRTIRNLKIVHSNTINYSYKFADRSELVKLCQLNADFDDILIVKNGFVCDTSFANILFFDGKDWFTPSTFLLNGTMRQCLLRQGQIAERQIGVEDLKLYSKAMIINAMLPFDTNRCFEVAHIQI